MKRDTKDKIKTVIVLIVGAWKTGKTILTDYLRNNSVKFKNYIPSIGADYGIKVFLYKNNPYKIEMWDLSGLEAFFSMAKRYMEKAHIFFILFNYNDRRTFDYAKTLLNERKNEQQVFVLVGAKYDLKINKDKKGNYVHEEEVLELADEKNTLCAHLSTLKKYSNGVNLLLKKSFDEYIKKRNLQ